MLPFTIFSTLLTLLSFVAASPTPQKRAFGFNAPHYTLYLNDEFSASAWPSAASIKPYNRLLLAFWQTNGAVASPKSWAGFTDAQRQAILTDYHNNGIAIMVSAFADDDHILSNKKDPVQTAQALGAWVKQYGVDGVDIDLEDFTPLQQDQAFALNWLTQFHQELAKQLPAGQYAISSTPTAWMYGSAFGGANSVYCQLNKAVGDSITWYNFQFYNGQGNGWNNCQRLMWSNEDPAYLSLKQISDQCGIPMNKITVGKLWDTADQATKIAGEIPTGTELGQCITQAKGQIAYPETGIMVWAYHTNNAAGAVNYLKDAVAAIAAAPATPAAATNATAPAMSGAVTNGTAAVSGSVSGGVSAPVSSQSGAAPNAAVSGAASGSGASGVSAPTGASLTGSGSAANGHTTAANAQSTSTSGAMAVGAGVVPAALAAVAAFFLL